MRRKSQPASAMGLKIVARPLEEPLRRTVPNAAEEHSIMLQRVENAPQRSFGYIATAEWRLRATSKREPQRTLNESLLAPEHSRQLAARMGEEALRRRLAREREQETRHFHELPEFLHHEHLTRFGRFVHFALSATGLRARGRRNTLAIQVRRNEVRLPTLPAALDGYTLLHLSDLHVDGGGRYLHALAETVRGIACDACVMTGDFRFATRGSCAPAIDAIGRLAPALPQPVYAVLGNHDSIALVPPMEALGWRVLMNERAVLGRGGAQLHLAGIDDAHYFRTHDIARALQGVAREECSVLLSHTPEAYRDAAAAGVSLMLSGHTHGGQICLPGGLPVITDCPAPRRFSKGPWRFGAMHGYTSVGCGYSSIDARFHCPPEVTLHVLRRA
jgi:uncharacterized protein